MWDKRATVVAVHDGDTITAVLDQGFGQTTQITVRLFGVFAPELKEHGGPEVRGFVERWMSEMEASWPKWPFVITTVRGPKVGKELLTFGRYLAIVTDSSHTRNLNAEVTAFIKECGFVGGVGS